VAVRIRLRRIGKKKQPQYRLVVAEAAGPRDGRFIESIGHYNPRLDPPAVSVNEERALWWLRQGAQPTDTARSMLVRTGVWEKFAGETGKALTGVAPQAAPAGDSVPGGEPAASHELDGETPREETREESPGPSAQDTPEGAQGGASEEE
jgi:small subunit ribosomal protein S16